MYLLSAGAPLAYRLIEKYSGGHRHVKGIDAAPRGYCRHGVAVFPEEPRDPASLVSQNNSGPAAEIELVYRFSFHVGAVDPEARLFQVFRGPRKIGCLRGRHIGRGTCGSPRNNIGMFRIPPFSRYYKINGKLIAGTKNSPVIMGIGDPVQYEDKNVFFLPQPRDEIIKAYINSGASRNLGLKGDSHVVRSKPVKIV